MLGCQDFCGYYEWTFHYLRRRYGENAVKEFWEEAIAMDSQSHYIEAAQQEKLRGLYKTWVHTGIEEQCDWFVELHEDENLLRLDMHQCPSKGFLLDNNRNADEDYCDHCIGWIAPAIETCGLEVTAHEHNHCGQCFWEIRSSTEAQPPVSAEHDIRQDPLWNLGYLDRFAHNHKTSVGADCDVADLVALLPDGFREAKRLVVLGNELPHQCPAATDKDTALICDGARYASTTTFADCVCAVSLGHDPSILARVAERFHESAQPPLLLHPYLPQEPRLDFVAHQLPRATPMLPFLIHQGLYVHDPMAKAPDPSTFSLLIAAALRKPTTVQGVIAQPDDVEHYRRAKNYAEGRIEFLLALSQQAASP